MFVAAVLAFLAVAEANIDFVKVNRLAHPTIVPETWKEGMIHKAALPLKENPTTYLVIDEYVGSSTCGGTAKMSVGTGFEVCTATSATTSMMYKNSAKAGYYSMAMYTTPDCSGAASSYDTPIPNYCLPSGDNGYKYSVVNSTAPWKSQTIEGTVGEIYYSADACSQTGSGPVYSWFSTDYCMGSTGDDGSQQSVIYSSCSGGSITYKQFSDTACTTFVKEQSFPLYQCLLSTDASEWVTRECTANK